MRENTIVGVHITEILHETPKAILVRFSRGVTHKDGNATDTHWFPLSRVTRITHPGAANGFKGVLYTEKWLIETNFPDDSAHLIVDANTHESPDNSEIY